MSLKINAGSLMANRYIKVEEKGIVYCNTDLFGTKRFKYEQIDFIYLSPTNILSFQVDKQVFSLPIQPAKKEHNEALAAFLEAVKRSRSYPELPPQTSLPIENSNPDSQAT